MRREAEKEKRDRDFWSVMFGGEASETEMYDTTDPALTLSDDELIARSMLSRR